ncbi:MAG: riboflavin synthase [Acidobacteria bacterium]|nr:riboflavin synthase [Acidobacteriota bacterium]
MFTGIIEEVGEIVEISDAREFRTIRVRARAVMDDLRIGSSIAVNGVCLTARSIDAYTFSAEMSRETLDRTTLGGLRQGSIVNLERPMRADSRFGGHIVQGHVDGVGRIRRFDREGDNWILDVETPANSSGYLVEKGSIAVDGISLTVAGLRGSNAFSVAIIPHTFENTNLKSARAGDPVNLEFDVIAKYVENLLKPYAIRNN